MPDVLGENPGPRKPADPSAPARSSPPSRITTSRTTTPAAIIGEFKKLGLARVKAPQKIVIVLDHIVPRPMKIAPEPQDHPRIRPGPDIPNFFDIQHGVCHQVSRGWVRPARQGHHGQRFAYHDLWRLWRLFGRHRPDGNGLDLGDRRDLAARAGNPARRVSWRFPHGRLRQGRHPQVIGDNGADRANYEAVELAGPSAHRFSLASRMVLADTGRREWAPRTAISSPTK